MYICQNELVANTGAVGGHVCTNDMQGVRISPTPTHDPTGYSSGKTTAKYIIGYPLRKQ